MIRVDELIDRHWPTVGQRRPLLRRPVQSILRFLFHEQQFQQFERERPHLQGFDFIDAALDYFEFSHSVSPRERERIPVTGRLVIVANHPIGSLDGLALLQLVGSIRQDVKAVANNLLMAIRPLHGLLLPVDNMGGRTPKENLRALYQHLEADGALIIFPAGEVSRMGPAGVRDGRWHSGFLRMAQKCQAPVLPVFIDGRNSAFFYSLSLIARPLSTLWLVREMFKQAENTVTVRIGEAITPAQCRSLPMTPKQAAKLLRKHVYRLGRDKPLLQFCSPQAAVAHPESRQDIRREIRQCARLGQTPDGKHIALYRYRSDSALMREIGRLRELTFRAVGEGTGQRRDVDRFDADYDHIVLWDDEALEVVGAYRLRRTAGVSVEALYTHTLFAFGDGFAPQLAAGLELGRSFVQPRYWGKRSLDYLWQGIGAYLNHHPEVRYLFGPVSISNHYPQAARDQLVRFYRLWFGGPEASPVSARQPYRPDACNFQPFAGHDYHEDFRQLKQTLAGMGCTVPTLYKQYTELCEPDGVRFLAFHQDSQFADCVDGLVVVDLTRVKPARRERYIGATATAAQDA